MTPNVQFEETFQAQPTYKREVSRMMQFVIDHSGGAIVNESQAALVLLVFAIIILIIAGIIFMTSGGPSVPTLPPSAT